jgi:MoaA/NifB/PqqE/SkfB family radical SAM enzyme
MTPIGIRFRRRIWQAGRRLDAWLLAHRWYRLHRLGRGIWHRFNPLILGGYSAIGLQAFRADRQDAARLKGRFCPNPFRQLDVYESGQAHLCCSTWLPTAAGNLKRESLESAWNSRSAQAIRASILDGSFSHCSHDACPAIQDGSLPTIEQARQDPQLRRIIDEGRTHLDSLPTFVNLCNDASCNLWCPSCRTHRINHTDPDVVAELRELQATIERAMFDQPTDRHFHVNITGSGDAFASRVFRDFLFGLDGADFPNLRINLQTNGVLLTPKNWRRMRRVHRNIDTVLVSFDAACEATYAITRRGGHWPTLLENTRALGEFRRRGELKQLRLDFVVQQANYREMPAFVELAESLGADHASFSKVMDWGTWPRAVFELQCIWDPEHPEFDEFLEVLRHPALGRPSVILGNLAPCRALALERGPEPAASASA